MVPNLAWHKWLIQVPCLSLAVFLALLMSLILQNESSARSKHSLSHQKHLHKSRAKEHRGSSGRQAKHHPETKKFAHGSWKGKTRGGSVAAAGKKVSKVTDLKTAPTEKLDQPDYQDETQLLSQAYTLKDQALNEQLEGNYGLAAKHLHQVTELAQRYYGKLVPSQQDLYLDLASAEEAAGQSDLSIRDYQTALECNPGCSEALYRLATLEVRQGQLKQAALYARKLLDIQPDDPRAHLILSALLNKSSDLQFNEQPGADEMPNAH